LDPPPLLSYSTLPALPQDTSGVRTCVIFNPVAKGEKARHLRTWLDGVAAHSTVNKTAAPGDARRLAAKAVTEGFEIIVAAGGDGTLNEVLNGIGDAPDGFDRIRLGVLPLGTVNVFAREMGVPLRVEPAWDAILRARETRLDLPWVEYADGGAPQRRYFAQLAGAGLDARAIELVHWPLKKKTGPLAYIIAGLKAMQSAPARITVTAAEDSIAGELVLIGNGRLYGGRYEIFPGADLRDGLLDVCVFPRANWLALARCGPVLLARGRLPVSAVQRFRAESFTLTSPDVARFELDGELAGPLPATFRVHRARLRVIVP
jgi:diacylglycerol kinase (ATP)